jgi:hypothetical protein
LKAGRNTKLEPTKNRFRIFVPRKIKKYILNERKPEKITLENEQETNTLQGGEREEEVWQVHIQIDTIQNTYYTFIV